MSDSTNRAAGAAGNAWALKEIVEASKLQAKIDDIFGIIYSSNNAGHGQYLNSFLGVSAMQIRQHVPVRR